MYEGHAPFPGGQTGLPFGQWLLRYDPRVLADYTVLRCTLTAQRGIDRVPIRHVGGRSGNSCLSPAILLARSSRRLGQSTKGVKRCTSEKGLSVVSSHEVEFACDTLIARTSISVKVA